MRRSSGQGGFTLVELMVSLMVGMMVVAALLAGYFAISVSSRHTRALTQMTEDASAALGVLRTHVAQAGYSRPVGVTTDGFQRVYAGAAVMGCDSSFKDVTAAIGALACADVTGNDALKDAVSVAYEADVANSIASAGVPLDCLGNALTIIGTGTNAYYLNTSTFYISNGVDGRGALFCRGSGGGTPQTLVENIADLQVLYGISTSLTANPVTVAYYGKASNVNMANVVAVRLCVVVMSSDEVMDDKTPYYDCSDTQVTPADKRMYRAFRSTVLLHNRLKANL
ncbi:PilW family protein [Ideonella sp. 4Y11]|uniref:PilW family protein n=2 Tax=Ideonella aquatica TaxID=2824119 RepID=A0A941BLE9_9BURK|nr:PilW family protein [Ideonella aquatica]